MAGQTEEGGRERGRERGREGREGEGKEGGGRVKGREGGRESKGRSVMNSDNITDFVIFLWTVLWHPFADRRRQFVAPTCSHLRNKAYFPALLLLQCLQQFWGQKIQGFL